MKRSNITILATAITSTLLMTSSFANETKNWSLMGALNFQTTLENTTNKLLHLTVMSNPHIIIGGDVFVRPNNVELICDEGKTKANYVLEPGDVQTCSVSPHGKATITMVPNPAGNIQWGATGQYKFSDLS